ncbi:MAG: hypothetical protein AAF304_01685 [Pseudomonadota bacterium]
MNSNWQEFLISQGAGLGAEGYMTFPEYEAQTFDEEQVYACDLSNLGLIRVSGEDAFSFLHGQFTNDLNIVNADTSQLSSYCNAKGRMLAIFRIFKRDDDYFLLLRRDVIEVVLNKLNMFKLMAKVELTDISNEIVIFGIAGPNTDSLLDENGIQAPINLDQVITKENTTAIKITSQHSRALIVTSFNEAKVIWNSIINQSVQMSYHFWELIDIKNGIPTVTAETIETFIPQMVNLELIGGVNFQKGCYPGQEIVARTHYLGKPNRRMYRIQFECNECPAPGTNIFSKANSEQPVGKIVSAQKANSKHCETLTVLRTEKELANDLHLEAYPNSIANIKSLPYGLDAN